MGNNRGSGGISDPMYLPRITAKTGEINPEEMMKKNAYTQINVYQDYSGKLFIKYIPKKRIALFWL
jgi:hypothetical protein